MGKFYRPTKMLAMAGIISQAARSYVSIAIESK
jgi:hypothetical protein